MNHAEYFGSGVYSDSSLSHFINNLIWDNWLNELYIVSVPPIFEYCDIQDTLVPGTGNISADPLFRDTANGDFHLMATYCGDPYDSPCIDAGDPDIVDFILDCDFGLGGTRSDMGAYGGDNLGHPTGIIEEEEIIPQQFALFQNYPNPFNASTTISFDLLESQVVTLTAYDILGRIIKTMIDGYLEAGTHIVIFDGAGLTSGIYFARLETDNATESIKMLLLR
ncbi:MAG: T9SS type A sorting domain-containing protein [Candidatus Zixiibacteriota bacterium]|nr:MAG: T9SS type A sorting domain-containing protein [candidate division Zixibacteria bacterium]